MTLRSHTEQVAYEQWSFRLADACEEHGLPFPCDPALRWYRGQTVEEIIGELKCGRRAA